MYHACCDAERSHLRQAATTFRSISPPNSFHLQKLIN